MQDGNLPLKNLTDNVQRTPYRIYRYLSTLQSQKYIRTWNFDLSQTFGLNLADSSSSTRNSVGTQRRLRSTTIRAAVVRRTRTQFGRRSFSVCGPDALPPSYPHHRLLPCFPAFAKNTPISYCFSKLVLIRFFYHWLCNERSADFFSYYRAL